jgi:hypothetical protein
MLQGDSLAVQLFIGAAAISVLAIAITQAGWTQRWFIRGLFALAALLSIASVWWRHLEIRIPLINDVLQAVAASRVAWFFMGIVPALVTGMLLSDLLRHRRSRTARPSKWVSVLAAKDTLARQDLIDRYQYVSRQFHEALEESGGLADQLSELMSKMFSADDPTLFEGAEKYATLAAQKDASGRKFDEWHRTLENCTEALRTNIHDQLRNGSLIAKGFLAPHAPGASERIIPKEEWRFLSLDNDGNQAQGPNFEYIALLIGKPGH